MNGHVTYGSGASLYDFHMSLDQRVELENSCKSDFPSRFENYLTSILPLVPGQVDLHAGLRGAMRDGPHYSTMQHLIARHNVEVRDSDILDAGRLKLPAHERMELLNFLYENSDFDINSQVDGWYTLLRYCYEDNDMTRCLLENGANPNLGPAAGRPASYWGANQLSDDVGSALTTAVSFGTTEVVETLVEYGAVLTYGCPVHFAVKRHDQSMLRKILELGANVDEDDMTRFRLLDQRYGSPLMRAIKTGKLEMVQILLEHGADIRYRDTKGVGVMDLLKGDQVDPEIKAAVVAAWANEE